MYDAHHRPYHQQQYRNAADNREGIYLDSLEIRFLDALFPAQREVFEQVAKDWAGEALLGIHFSRLDLVGLELRAGYYQPENLAAACADAKLEPAALHPFYAGRFDETIPASAGNHRF